MNTRKVISGGSKLAAELVLALAEHKPNHYFSELTVVVGRQAGGIWLEVCGTQYLMVDDQQELLPPYEESLEIPVQLVDTLMKIIGVEGLITGMQISINSQHVVNGAVWYDAWSDPTDAAEAIKLLKTQVATARQKNVTTLKVKDENN